jgi:hypothetical protein
VPSKESLELYDVLYLVASLLESSETVREIVSLDIIIINIIIATASKCLTHFQFKFFIIQLISNSNIKITLKS